MKSELTRNTSPNVPSADAQAVADGNTAFALDLYDHVAASEDGNFFYSPYSISVALALTSRGQNASGSDDEPFRLEIANSIWACANAQRV